MANAGLTYEALETAFRHRNFKPLYLLYGDERFLIDTLQEVLISSALAKNERDFNLDVVYGVEIDAPSVLALCASYPMMAERRVVVVRDFDKIKNNQLFKAYAEQPNPAAVVLLICGGKPNFSAHPYRALKAKAVWGQFKPLYEKQMPGWIEKRVNAKGRRMSPRAVQMLADYVGNNLYTAAGEIDKLITYAGECEQLTEDDVLAASGQNREYNVFELQRAIGEKRHPDAMRITERLLRQATNPRSEGLMIVAILTAFFTKLWKLTVCQTRNMSDKAMAARIGVSPYFIKEYLFSLKQYEPSDIERAFTTLLAADYELKGGSSRNEWLVLDLLLRRLAFAPAST